MHAWLLSCVWLFVTLWSVAQQAPLSIGFPREEYWRQLPFPPPGDLPNPGNLPNPGIELMSPVSPALAGWFFTTESPGKPIYLPTHTHTHTHSYTLTHTHSYTHTHTHTLTHSHIRLGGANMAGTWMDRVPYLLQRWKASTLSMNTRQTAGKMRLKRENLELPLEVRI